MNTLILNLEKISDEEEIVLERRNGIDKSLYAQGKGEFVVYGENFLADKPVTIRKHTRFTAFPLHGHDYTEIMYVLSGTIIHRINGEEVKLVAGDLLFMNKHVRHSIDLANAHDIGINFIMSDDFLNSVWGSTHDELLSRFIAENFKQNGLSQYLHFRTQDNYPITNLLNNLLYTVENDFDDAVTAQTMALLFNYLSFFRDTLINDALHLNKTEKQKQFIEKYLVNNYKTATLTELAHELSFTQEYLSRWIATNYGFTFRELLQQQRLAVAERLLKTTDMNVADIILAVGYFNSSYFYRIFLQKNGVTPWKWRNAVKK